MWHAAWWIGKGKGGKAADVESATVLEQKIDRINPLGENIQVKMEKKEEGNAVSKIILSSDTASDNTFVNVEGAPAQKDAKPKVEAMPENVLWWMLPYCIGAAIAISGLILMVVDEIGSNRAVERMTLVVGSFSTTALTSPHASWPSHGVSSKTNPRKAGSWPGLSSLASS
jgi:hypothetical protein